MGGSVIDIQTEQVVGENKLGNIAATVATLFIDAVEQVIGLDQNVARATGRIQHTDALRRYALGGLARQLGQHLGRLFTGRHIVGHGLGQGGIGIGLHPIAAHRVLHQILHYPVGGKELGGGRDILGFDHLADDFIFFVTDIELIEPADHLDLLPVRFRDLVYQWPPEGVGAGQSARQQQFGFIINGFEQERHRLMQAVALAQQQLAQQRLLLITGQQQLQQGGLIQRHAFAK